MYVTSYTPTSAVAMSTAAILYDNNFNYSNVSAPAMDSIVNQVIDKISNSKLINHKCNNCGASLRLDKNKPIFICPYCDSTYVINKYQFNNPY